MRNLLFFDIDGTLITGDQRKIFPEDAKEALRQARDRGSLLFINTGRVFCNVDDFIREAGFDGYVCGCGSHILYDGKTIFHHELPQSLCRRVALQCRKDRIAALFEYADYTAIDSGTIDPERDQLIRDFRQKGRKLVTDIMDPDFRFDKFTAWYEPDSDLTEFKEFIRPYFTYIDRERNFCELEQRGYSKATGIQFLMQYFDTDIQHVYVFGDGNNDLEMFALTPNSICMAGGSPDARKKAAFLTKDVMDGGIRYALEHYHLI